MLAPPAASSPLSDLSITWLTTGRKRKYKYEISRFSSKRQLHPSEIWSVALRTVASTKDKVERDRKDMNKRAIKTLVMAAAISSPLAIALPPIKTGPYASNPTLRAITAWV